jgi:hypothetical protein
MPVDQCLLWYAASNSPYTNYTVQRKKVVGGGAPKVFLFQHACFNLSLHFCRTPFVSSKTSRHFCFFDGVCRLQKLFTSSLVQFGLPMSLQCRICLEMPVFIQNAIGKRMGRFRTEHIPRNSVGPDQGARSREVELQAEP